MRPKSVGSAGVNQNRSQLAAIRRQKGGGAGATATWGLSCFMVLSMNLHPATHLAGS